jgi:hypothetical protein
MSADAETLGDIFLAWKKDPIGETLRTIESSSKDKVFVEGYATFHLPTRITRQKLTGG